MEKGREGRGEREDREEKEGERGRERREGERESDDIKRVRDHNPSENDQNYQIHTSHFA